MRHDGDVSKRSLQAPANVERLLRSIADAEAARTKVQELIDPQHDVT